MHFLNCLCFIFLYGLYSTFSSLGVADLIIANIVFFISTQIIIIGIKKNKPLNYFLASLSISILFLFSLMFIYGGYLDLFRKSIITLRISFSIVFIQFIYATIKTILSEMSEQNSLINKIRIIKNVMKWIYKGYLHG